jgi:hypothetical protein
VHHICNCKLEFDISLACCLGAGCVDKKDAHAQQHTHLMMCSVSQFPRTFSPKLLASSPGKGSRAPKSCTVTHAK